MTAVIALLAFFVGAAFGFMGAVVWALMSWSKSAL